MGDNRPRENLLNRNNEQLEGVVPNKWMQWMVGFETREPEVPQSVSIYRFFWVNIMGVKVIT